MTFKADSKEQIRHHIAQLFDAISPKYDFINRVLSFGLDQHWRKKVCDYLPNASKIKLLDLGTGTGDQIIMAFNQCNRIQKAIGVDLSEEMLKIGMNKLSKKPYAHLVKLMKGDATKLPFENNIADAITMSFGIRNVTSALSCLQEMHRVLSPGGRAIILEFSLPKNLLIKSLHLFYLRRILPFVGGVISKNMKAYRYLNQTIETFPYGNDFCTLVEKAGFSSVTAKSLTFGIVSLYIAQK